MISLPELPEVETVRRSLEKVLPGQIIEGVDLWYSPLISSPPPEIFLQLVTGRAFKGVDRRGKFLLFSLGDLVMAVHLRMTGALMFSKKESPYEKHTHLTLSLQGEWELRYVDPRKFGRFLLLQAGEDIGERKGLGPEPLAPSLHLSSFKGRIQNRRGRMKSLLLNQNFLAGIGNIYSDEILFQARIHPGRKANTCSEEELERLYYSIQQVLTEGISCQGTTISDYRDGAGEEGFFQHRLQVYGREGQKCLACGEVLLREKYNGRSSVYCPCCQR